MRLGFIADRSKSSLMVDFCVAYKMILRNHELFATEQTGRRIEEATNLSIYKYLPGILGGVNQLVSQIKRSELDALFYFINPDVPPERLENDYLDAYYITRLCDEYLIPIATNIASGEALVLGIANGDLDWRLP